MQFTILELAYDLFSWFLYSLLLYRHLIPLKGDKSFIAVYFANIISIFLTFLFYPDILIRQFIFLVPVIFVSKYYFKEEIQWRMIVIFLSTLIMVLPESFFKVVSYYLFHISSFELFMQHNWLVLILAGMVFIGYKMMNQFYFRLYREEVQSENKIMMIMILSVVVFAFIPITYFLGSKNIIYFILFALCGLFLDFLLIDYIYKYAQFRQVEKIQNMMHCAKQGAEGSNNDLYELRHDISNYMNALKILQRQKENKS